MNSIAEIADLQLIDADEVRRTLQLLLPPGQLTELRVLDGKLRFGRWPSTLTGYFDDAEKLIAELANVESAKACYIIPNPVNPALLARAVNRIKQAGKGEATSDGDIVSRRWLLIDCDPLRPSGISATDSEHTAAIARCDTIRDHLHFNCGWQEPIFGDSSNGAHLLYRVDLPADDGGLISAAWPRWTLNSATTWCTLIPASTTRPEFGSCTARDRAKATAQQTGRTECHASSRRRARCIPFHANCWKN